jgi:hypothetical protein
MAIAYAEVAYVRLHGALFQVSIHKDPRAPSEEPYHVMLCSRESDYLGRGPDEAFFKSIESAKRSCYRRFGIRLSAWKDAWASSKARLTLEAFAREQGIRLNRPRAWPDSMSDCQEFVVATTKTSYGERRIMLDAADTVLCASMKVEAGVVFEVLHKDQVSRYSEAFPTKYEDFRLLEVEPHETPAKADYSVWFARSFRREFLDWFRASNCHGILQAARFSPTERLFVRCENISLVFDCRRPILTALALLARIAAELPGIQIPPGGFVVDGWVMDPSRIPDALRPLVPLTKRWAISDDEKRANKLARASAHTRERLIQTVEPLFPEINRYLDSFGDDTMPEEAVLIMYLAEAVAEIS